MKYESEVAPIFGPGGNDVGGSGGMLLKLKETMISELTRANQDLDRSAKLRL